ITELADYMREHSSAWERQRARAAFHRRLAMGSSCLFLSFLGLGMALFFGKPGASGRGAGFAGGIVALFTFYILLRVTENLAVSGAGPAGVLLWAPNAAAGLIGAVFLFMAVRR
ncbi:MAG: LptF/LptG family permease, partial [Myxococcota bacterium]